MDIQNHAESLAEKMNRITGKFKENIETAEEMTVVGGDIIDCIGGDENFNVLDIIKFSKMVEDFNYVRETLKENTENGRRILNAIALELLSSEDEKRANLIISFAELNRAIVDNMKLYILSYKEISKILIEIEKLKSIAPPPPTNTFNTINFNQPEAISTMDLIKKLKEGV